MFLKRSGGTEKAFVVAGLFQRKKPKGDFHVMVSSMSRELGTLLK